MAKLDRKYKLLQSCTNIFKLLSLLFLFSCTGPVGPFGSVDSFMPPKAQKDFAAINFDNKSTITFERPYQVWHGPMNLAFKVESSTAFDNSSELLVFYNQKDITYQLENWQVEQLNSNTRLYRWPKKLYLSPHSENQLIFAFKANNQEQWTKAELLPPECSVDQNIPLRSMDEFRGQWQMLNRLEKIAVEKSINPSYFAGLLASLSSFDNSVVGPHREIGIAQIGPLEALQIEVGKPHWERIKTLDTMNPIGIRLLHLLGTIDAKQDWRLDEEKSLLGSIEYLSMIKSFWSTTSNQVIFKQAFNQSEEESTIEYPDIISASYMEGPVKVLEAVKNYGKFWRSFKDMKRASFVAAKSRSYCSQFSKVIK